MSFAHLVKSEVLDNAIQGECCKLAFLSSVIHSCGELTKSGKDFYLELKTDMEKIYPIINDCLKTLYGEYAEVKLDDDANINKSVRYVISLPKTITDRIMFDCGIAKVGINNEFALITGIDEHIIENDCCAKTYIKGVFAASSTSNIIVNSERIDSSRKFSGYHWEFVFTSEDFCDDFSSLLFAQGIANKKSKRKNLFVLYIKEAEVVSDLFAIVGAVKGLLTLQNEMALREVRNNINRQNNCMNANITKTVNASLKQIKAINKIQQTIGFEKLPQNLRELCLLRLSNPEESLDNLTKLMSTNITKSGINHQFRRIIKIADKIEKKEQEDNNLQKENN
ncbi:MAG: DNA-binding protein WhiA [Clostridia bacterium]|nr:DNA-binding protein WhiA [Clostridia bacterium]